MDEFQFRWTPKRPDLKKLDGLPDVIQKQGYSWMQKHANRIAKDITDRLRSGFHADKDGNVQPLPQPTRMYKEFKKRTNQDKGIYLYLTGQLLNSVKARPKRDGDSLSLIVGFSGRRAKKDTSKLRAKYAALFDRYVETHGFTTISIPGHQRGSGMVSGYTRRMATRESARLTKRLTGYANTIRNQESRTPVTNAKLGTILASWVGNGVFSARRRVTPLMQLTTKELEKYQSEMTDACAPKAKEAVDSVVK
jgi:hypothetical protein